MCHKFLLPSVLILKFANTLEILLIWENRNLLNHYEYNMAKNLFLFLIRVGMFCWKKSIVIEILFKMIKKKQIPLFFFLQHTGDACQAFLIISFIVNW